MRSKIDALKTKADRLSGELSSVRKQIKEKREERDALIKSIELHEKARQVINEAAKNTQQFFKAQVETLVTTAIRTVFDRPFEFKLIFEEKRNKIEARPVIKEGENEYDPKDEMGGGIIDIISFALRVVLWSLQTNRTRNVFILDEPFKWTGALMVKAGMMLKELSDKLGIQVIMITHDDELMDISDKTWIVRHNGEKSIVKEMKV